MDTPNTLYLTFDDGPDPEVTSFVLELLKAEGILATFFCVGENAVKHPEIIQQLQNEGHSIGNHTMHHRNGWKTDYDTYIADVKKAETATSNALFRPPYGKISKKQARSIIDKGYQIIMWTILTYDYDNKVDTDKIIEKIKKKTSEGAIITFHDSKKAFPQLKIMLPKLIQYWKERGFQFGYLNCD